MEAREGPAYGPAPLLVLGGFMAIQRVRKTGDESTPQRNVVRNALTTFEEGIEPPALLPSGSQILGGTGFITSIKEGVLVAQADPGNFTRVDDARKADLLISKSPSAAAGASPCDEEGVPLRQRLKV